MIDYLFVIHYNKIKLMRLIPNTKRGAKTVPRPKLVDKSTMKALRVPDELLSRIENSIQSNSPYARINFSEFAIDALEEKIKKIEKKQQGY